MAYSEWRFTGGMRWPILSGVLQGACDGLPEQRFTGSCDSIS